jgi:hypothetical protein
VSRAGRIVGLAAAAWVAAAAVASAQTNALPGGVEVAFGVTWLIESDLGIIEATESTPAGTATRLFTTSSSLGSAGGFGVSLGVPVSRRLEAELVASYATPSLSTVISNDIETTIGATAVESVKQYTIGGGVLWYLTDGRRSRLHPYIAGSFSYLRQLHEGDTLAATGHTIGFGGGVKYVLRARAKGLRAVGIRGDARMSAVSGGVGFEDRVRYAPVLGASLFLRF